MAYNRNPRNAFIKDAFTDGYSIEDINAYLTKKGYEPVNKVEKAVYGNKISAGTGIAGGVAGTALAGKPGAAIGATGGKAIGNLIEDIYEISKGAYKVPKDYKEATDVAINNIADAGKWGIGAEFLVNLPAMLKTLVTPFQTTKNVSANVRTKSIGDMTTSAEQAQNASLENLKLNKYYNMATPDTQTMAQNRLAQYYGQINPNQTVNPGVNGTVGGQSMLQQSPNLRINDMYQALTPFEEMGKAYNKSGEAGGTAIGQGTNLASRAIRQYLNSQIPQTAQIANNVYSTVSKIQPYAQKTVGGIAAYALVRNLVNKLLNSFDSK